jgi:hypothetical protein
MNHAHADGGPRDRRDLGKGGEQVQLQRPQVVDIDVDRV